MTNRLFASETPADRFRRQSEDEPAALVTRINLPVPKIGGKIWLLETKGTFLLEEGEGMIVTIACTHAGSGGIMVFDGVPDGSGRFPDSDHPGIDDPAQAGMEVLNGRCIYKSTQAAMGSWMMNGGFFHGLTVKAIGGHNSACAIASIVWMPRPAPR